MFLMIISLGSIHCYLEYFRSLEDLLYVHKDVSDILMSLFLTCVKLHQLLLTLKDEALSMGMKTFESNLMFVCTDCDSCVLYN